MRNLERYGHLFSSGFQTGCYDFTKTDDREYSRRGSGDDGKRKTRCVRTSESRADCRGDDFACVGGLLASVENTKTLVGRGIIFSQ